MSPRAEGKAEFLLIRKTLIPPATPAPPGPAPRVPLAGCDAIYDHFQVKAAFFFNEPLNPTLLKVSLAKALDAYPLLAGRARQGSNRDAWIDCCGSGVQVIEQIARVTGKGGLHHGDTLAFMPRLARGGFKTAVNNAASPILTVTLTEVTYGESFSCGPRLLSACSCRCNGEDEWEQEAAGTEGAGGGDVERRPPSPSGTPGGTDGENSLRPTFHASSTTPVPASTPAAPNPGPVIQYALGLSCSHSVGDGSTIAHFLGAWSRASTHLPIQPALNNRDLLLDPGPWGEARLPPPAKFREVSTWTKARILWRFAWQQGGCETVILRFDKSEVEEIKRQAMKRLHGTEQWVSTSNALAAHLWPIVSALWSRQGESEGGRESDGLVPMSIVVNSRKHLKVPGHYCGNVVSIQDVPACEASEDLTSRALKIRYASACSEEEAWQDHHYMQWMHSRGRAGKILYTRMKDMIEGKPGILWDDISSFQSGAMVHLKFGKAVPMGADLLVLPIPGTMFVVAPPATRGQGEGGKEVRVALTAKMARKLRSSEWQGKVHRYRPWPMAHASSAMEAKGGGGEGEEAQLEEGGEETKFEEKEEVLDGEKKEEEGREGVTAGQEERVANEVS